MDRLKTRHSSIKVRCTQLFAAASVLIVSGTALFASNGVVSADSTDDFCVNGGNVCLNAWGGGPAVNVFGPGVTNDKFFVINSSISGDVNIQFIGNGNGPCIGDYGNDSGTARAGLVGGCGTSGIGWGGNFVPISCSSGGNTALEFRNVHWGGYLGPQNNSNGSPFYLNKPTPYCFVLT